MPLAHGLKSRTRSRGRGRCRGSDHAVTVSASTGPVIVVKFMFSVKQLPKKSSIHIIWLYYYTF